MELFFIIFGSIFLVAGLIVFVATIAEEAFIALIFLLCFGGVGLAISLFGWVAIIKRHKAIRDGDKVWGVIVDYADDNSMYINGVPALDIIVRCEFFGKDQVCRLHTGSSNEGRFPIGASIQLSVYEGKVVFIRNSVGKFSGANA